MSRQDPLGTYPDLGSLHTFVEFSSNTMVLGEMEFLHHLKDIVQGTLPIRLLCDAAHEMTHHWCFNTPVGNALALLKLRANAAAIYGKTQRELFSPLIKLECALAMMRPLAEGLALFAEFDLLPGPGDVRSQVSGWLLYLFAREGMEKKDYWDNALNVLFRHGRSSKASSARRENLFVQPLSADAGGYLPGYLLIKTRWNTFKLSDSHLKDAELFLCFCRSFFYHDLELASLLLKDDSDPDEGALEIIDYLRLRMELFVRIDQPKSIEEFHEYTRKLTLPKLLPGRGVMAQALERIPGIYNDEVDITIARDRFQRASDSVYDFPADMPREIGQVSMWIFQQRDLLWLGGAPGRVVVNSSKRVVFSIDGKPVVGTPVLEGIEEQEEDGTIEAFFSTNYIQLFFVVSIKGRPVAIMFLTNAPELFAKEIRNSIVDRARYLRVASAQEEVISEFLKQQPLYGLLEEMRRICAEHRDEVFPDIALHCLDPNERGECKTKMMRRGFWNIIGGNLSAIRQFALLSEIVAYDAPQAELETVKEKLAWALFTIEAYVRDAGFPETQIDTDKLEVFI